MTADDYRRQLSALLPHGLAWPRSSATVLQRLLLAWADELARLDGRALALIEEAYPDTVGELISEWERAYGLPDACYTSAPTEIAERRAVLWAKVIAQGGQSIAYYLAVAAAIGWEDSEIYEHRAYTVGACVRAPLNGPAWAYAWEMRIPVDPDPQLFDVNCGVGEALASWGDAQRECVFRRIKPAHTHILFAYSAAGFPVRCPA